jgi:hypothetical protein
MLAEIDNDSRNDKYPMMEAIIKSENATKSLWIVIRPENNKAGKKAQHDTLMSDNTANFKMTDLGVLLLSFIDGVLL